ncbi:MAG TPA: hypothetical protein VGM10_09430 [Actinocrinis sp.]
MTMTDEIRKTLSDPKPLYALAGAGDLAAEKLKDAPTLAADAAQAVTSLAGRIASGAPERLAKVQALIADMPAALDPKSARDALRDSADKVAPQALRERAQSIVLAQVGRALEAAGKAVETYDELAERGKSVVARYRGDETVVAGVTVVVEQVVEEDEGDGAVFVGEPGGAFDDAAFEAAAYDRVREPGTETKADTGADTAAAPKKSAASATSASAAKKTASTPRKRAASSKDASPKPATSTGSASSTAKSTARKTSTAKSTKN